MYSGVRHLPAILEGVVREAMTLNKLNISGNIITVNCNESCSHTEGLHVFLEIDKSSMLVILFMDDSTIIRASLKEHAIVHDIVYIDNGSYS